MIPLSLSLKNFVSYKSLQEIDFGPYELLCLSGKNGHGKSALLDAITWAIWGQARKASGVAKADEGLLHLGQTHMMVMLDFICNGDTYRVKREFLQTPSKGQSQLEFGILDPTTGLIRPLTDKTIRATQAVISRAIGLDYDGFVNSVFLRQGQSHEFSKKTPKERKEILAAILGLDRFEEIRKHALEKAKEAHQASLQQTALATQLSAELAQKESIDTSLAAIINERKLHEEQLRALQQEQQDIAQQRAALEKVTAQQEQISFKAAHLTKQLDGTLKELRADVATWRSTGRALRKQVADHTLQEQQQKVQKQLEQLRVQAAQALSLQEELSVTQSTYAEVLQQHEQDVQRKATALERAMTQVTQEHALEAHKKQELAQLNLRLTQELATLDATIAKKKKICAQHDQHALEKVTVQLTYMRDYFQYFVARGQSIKKNAEDLQAKQTLLEQSDTASCPLCEQQADAAHIVAKLTAKQRLYEHQLKRLTLVCTTVQQRIHALSEEQSARMTAHQAAQSTHEQLNELTIVHQQRSQELATTTKQLKEQTQRVAQLTHRLAEHTKAYQEHSATDHRAQNKQLSALRTKIEQLEQKKRGHAYSEDAEKKLHEELCRIGRAYQEQQNLLSEHTLQHKRKELIAQQCTTARTLKQELHQLEQMKPDYQGPSAAVLHKQEQTVNDALAAHTKQAQEQMRTQGALEAQRERLEAKDKELTALQSLRATLATEQQDYEAIAQAMGKDGIQALLIEEALPELEHEANQLLSQLTDNQAHISIESLRDTKSGTTRETLDIKISDAAGVRPYEMFSGGEAFRIDFALRVALSKLLARRAGTSLQTLIIDEGFGSQDDDGLSYIMDALHAIQKDFAKIIVVSHLDTMKEQFPVHFHVHKSPQGSTVSVIKHC